MIGAVPAEGPGVAVPCRLKIALGRLEFTRGHIEQAAELTDGVLAIKPREGEALYLRGLIRLAEGDTTEALDAWRSSLEVSLEARPR